MDVSVIAVFSWQGDEITISEKYGIKLHHTYETLKKEAQNQRCLVRLKKDMFHKIINFVLVRGSNTPYRRNVV